MQGGVIATVRKGVGNGSGQQCYQEKTFCLCGDEGVKIRSDLIDRSMRETPFDLKRHFPGHEVTCQKGPRMFI